MSAPTRPLEIEERDFSTSRRAALADKGHAMSDGSYPIETSGDVKNAVQALGRAPAGERAAVRRHIIKNARRIGALSALPDDWAVTEAAWAAARARIVEAFLPGGGGDGEVQLGDVATLPDETDGPGPVTPGTRGPAVERAQRKLGAAGFQHSDTPGFYGPSTIAAVQAFQRSKGMRPHGHLDEPTLEALDSNSNMQFVT